MPDLDTVTRLEVIEDTASAIVRIDRTNLRWIDLVELEVHVLMGALRMVLRVEIVRVHDDLERSVQVDDVARDVSSIHRVEDTIPVDNSEEHRSRSMSVYWLR